MIYRGLVGGLRRGISIGVMAYALALLFGGLGWADSPPEGLPNSPEMPDLYDLEIVNTYALVAKRPYAIDGHALAPWLIATVLTPKAVHIGPPHTLVTRDAIVRAAEEAMLIIGYVTDTRDGRIIALTETLGNPSDDTRRIKAWVDQGWVEKGKGSGEWGPPMLSDTALTRQQTATFLEPLYRSIQTGFEKTVKR